MTVSPKILVHSPLDGEAESYARLIGAQRPEAKVATSTTAADAQHSIADTEILVGRFFPPSVFARAPRLRWIHKISAGVEDVASNPDIRPDILLTRTDGALIAPRMIEYVLGAIFGIVQQFPRAWAQQRERRWQSFPVALARGSTVGVAGLGDIGTVIAGALAQNGMRVVGWRRTQTTCSSVERTYAGQKELASFAAACDFIVVVLPATEETRGLFSRDVFTAMKPSAWFVNVGRGSVVNEAALINAIREKTIAGAALDVFAEEPLPTESPLWSLENVLITPHVSGPIVPEDVVGCFLENLELYRRGEPLRRQINRTCGY
jgi:phosphoglycerate dehydrogenase-like enzyme